MPSTSNFIDVATIWLHAGKGGDGAVSFHREKFVAAGGPDGGDGGRGGNIVFQADPNLSTLMDFRYKRKYTAPDGENGRGARQKGKDADDLVIRVLDLVGHPYIMSTAAAELRRRYENHTPRPEDTLRAFLARQEN